MRRPHPELGRLGRGGAASLSGTLAARRPNDCHPDLGAGYPVLSFASRVGDFTARQDLVVSDGLSREPSYAATTLSLLAGLARRVWPGRVDQPIRGL